MRQLLVRFGVSDGSFVVGQLPLSLSPQALNLPPSPPPLALAVGRRGRLGSQPFRFQLSSFPAAPERLQP